MASGSWQQFTEHAATLLHCLPPPPDSSLPPQRDKSKGRSSSPHHTWAPLHLDDVDTRAFMLELADLKCTEGTQALLESAYTNGGRGIASSCTEAFEATMSSLTRTTAQREDLQRSEAAIRARFSFEYDQVLSSLSDTLLDEVRSARRRAELACPTMEPSLPRTQEMDVVASNPTQVAGGVFDQRINKILSTAFQQFKHLTKGERLALARRTGLSQKQVATWVSLFDFCKPLQWGTNIRWLLFQFANQRQRRTRQTTGPASGNEPRPHVEEFVPAQTRNMHRPLGPTSSALPIAPSKTSVEDMSLRYQVNLTLPVSPIRSSIEPLNNFGPFSDRTSITSYDSDISTLFHQIDSSGLSTSSLDSKWSQDTSESYYGLPLPRASDMQLSFELPPTEAIEHFDYSPDYSIWNAFDSSISSSSSSADSYVDDYTFQPPMGAEDANPLTCGLLTARQATFAQSPSSLGSSPLSTPDVEMDMVVDSVFTQLSEFGVLPVASDTSLAATSPV